jgi:hypothetical protein
LAKHVIRGKAEVGKVTVAATPSKPGIILGRRGAPTVTVAAGAAFSHALPDSPLGSCFDLREIVTLIISSRDVVSNDTNLGSRENE